MRSIKGKRVLVTGGAGFIGSHLCDELLRMGAQRVVCLDNFFLGKKENIEDASKHPDFVCYCDDARETGALSAILQKEKIEVVFNLATIALNYSFFNPLDAYMVNVKIANNLAEFLKLGLYQTLIQSSSSEAYGTALYSPMDEKHPINPTTPYAAGKVAADLFLHSLTKVEDLDISILRPFNNYGPRQNAKGSLSAIIPRTIYAIANNDKPLIEGDGEQTRDFVFVLDTVKAFIHTYENPKTKGKIINFGSGKGISINYLINMIIKKMNYQGNVERRAERKSDVRNLCGSMELAKQLLNFYPQTPFEDGIEITIDWYLANKKKVSQS